MEVIGLSIYFQLERWKIGESEASIYDTSIDL